MESLYHYLNWKLITPYISASGLLYSVSGSYFGSTSDGRMDESRSAALLGIRDPLVCKRNPAFFFRRQPLLEKCPIYLESQDIGISHRTHQTQNITALQKPKLNSKPYWHLPFWGEIWYSIVIEFVEMEHSECDRCRIRK